MRVARNTLQTWPTLEGENNPYYFTTRELRNQYFMNTTAVKGQYTAIGGIPSSTDWTSEVWEVDRFDGENWATVELDKNFALIITNEGIMALTNAAAGQYKLEISRIAIKQTSIVKGEDVSTWTHNTFVNSATYKDICLDTYNLGNTTFTLSRNLSYRTNLLNGGIQFTIELPQDCMGQMLTTQTTNAVPTLTEFYVAAIGLYVKDQRASDDKDILFAVANLPTRVEKLAGTPERVGNSLKFYLNTTLSNLGNVLNLTTVTSSVTSVPEVTTEDSLTDAFVPGINAPYNLYLVDNYNGTNIPAIATRKGNPTSTTYPVSWTFFTPTDDTVETSADVVDSTVKSFMVVAWNGSKYVPADSRLNNTQAGLYTNNHIIYAGKVTNTALHYNYSFIWKNEQARDYKVGDILQYTVNDTTFTITVVSVEPVSGQPLQFQVIPGSGMEYIDVNDVIPTYSPETLEPTGSGLKLKITSNDTRAVTWDFVNWVNKPLYADYNHNDGEPKGYTWARYCNEAGFSLDEDKDRRGLLTCVENEYTKSHFVGWCVGSNTIKLALDLRNEATYTTYGTTRYATEEEVRTTDPNAKEVVAITPKQLKNNYFQTSLPSDPDYTTQISANAGDSRQNPVIVNTYTKFTKSIECTGTDLNGVGFKGTAFRALWADLAEYYRADKVYPAGTLICMGSGLEEITMAITECNGIISSKPGYQLGEKKDDYDLPVALVGRVPVLFASDCTPQFGDRIYLSRTEPGKASTIINGKCLGKIIDKDKMLDQKRLIMCAVRIDF